MACEYCKTEHGLDESISYIWTDKFSFGCLGDLEIEAYISNCNKERKPVIDIQADITSVDRDTTDLGVKRIPINFCPFCGRDLNVEETPLIMEHLHKISDLQAAGEIANITANSLQRCGVVYLEDLSHLTKDQVKRFRRLGEKSLFYLEKLMENYDISFSKEDEVTPIMKALEEGFYRNTDVYFDFTSVDGKTHSVLEGDCRFVNSRSGFLFWVDSTDAETDSDLSPKGIIELLTIRNIRSSL